jgi:hypothetical protein
VVVFRKGAENLDALISQSIGLVDDPERCLAARNQKQGTFSTGALAYLI